MEVAVDASGNAIAVWRQDDGIAFNYNVWANRFVPGSGWGMAELIETIADDLNEPPQVDH